MDTELVEFYSQMSNFELSELILNYNNTLLAQLTVFTTALFAFLAAIFFAAHKLSKFQLISITFIYSGFCFVVVAGYFNMARGMAQTVLYVTGGDSSVTLFSMGILLIAGWILSLIFMRHTVKRNDT
ncbi:MAG: hypothetical protein DHS20C12_06710 [Pseudohongiella sp.]|nr:MAG: hypothetical protein DHS20C12_06710 [Pseudohongiella sp.]